LFSYLSRNLRLQQIHQGYLLEDETSRTITKVPTDSGEEIVKISDKITQRKKPLPESYFVQYLDNSSDITQAIATLCNYGLIPSEYAQKVLAMKEELSEKIKELLLTGKELDEELLTVNEAAEILRLSVPTIYGLMHKGDLSYMKRSKRCYFTKIDLMNYLKEGRRQSTLEKRTAAEQYLKNKKG